MTVTPTNDLHITWKDHNKWRDRSDCFYTLRYEQTEQLSKAPRITLYNTSYILMNPEPEMTYWASVRYTKGKRRTPWSKKVHNTTRAEAGTDWYFNFQYCKGVFILI